MTRIIFQTKGTLDKYIGDAVMAFWGAPFEEGDHAVRACSTALIMMRRVGELRDEWQAAGRPPLDIGIGLNTGTASVGNMGSQLRYGYTAMGDAVNLSSRLEGLNKEYRTHILVGSSTFEAARDAGFLFRELDLIRVKGKLQPVTIYELVALKDGTRRARGARQRFCARPAPVICAASGSKLRTCSRKCWIAGRTMVRREPIGSVARITCSRRRTKVGTVFS